jgi:acyl-CoA synthetase (AMP-forming)/AMP-acid ligase II
MPHVVTLPAPRPLQDRSAVEVLRATESLRTQRYAAAGLAARGIVAGDRFALTLPGSADYLSVVLGALRAGVVPVPLDPGLTRYERAPLLDDADVRLVIDSPQALADLLDNSGDADLAPVPLARPMHYTSGTTGRPKGVWSGVLEERAAAALLAEEVDLWEITATDRYLLASPLHHSAPLRFATTTLLTGGDVVLPGRFEPSAWIRAARDTHPTVSFVVPAHLQRLVAAGLDAPTLRSLRLLAHAGAPCPPDLKRIVLDLAPRGSLWEFYGSTEGQFTACSADEWLERPGSVGRARPGRTLTVTDGQLFCEVPTHARFVYWRDAEKTARAWRGSSFTVGDLGRIDDDGYVYLDGRRDDLIISGGVNVYPAEVEATLLRCPGVHDVAVFGVGDQRWGQAVHAAVVGDASTASIRAWAREHLAPAKRPKDYVIMPALPRTASGKVLRRSLADAAAPATAPRP